MSYFFLHLYSGECRINGRDNRLKVPCPLQTVGMLLYTSDVKVPKHRAANMLAIPVLTQHNSIYLVRIIQNDILSNGSLGLWWDQFGRLWLHSKLHGLPITDRQTG